MFELMDAYSQNAVIKVIGVGGGGGNAVEHMVAANIEGVDFVCANTDAQALKNSSTNRPWAACPRSGVLRLGGILFLSMHPTFALHLFAILFYFCAGRLPAEPPLPPLPAEKRGFGGKVRAPLFRHFSDLFSD